jgi:hypothetical protein
MKTSYALAHIEAKLSERATVHAWLDSLDIPKEEQGNTICLLRRLRIALDNLGEYKAADSVSAALAQLESSTTKATGGHL